MWVSKKKWRDLNKRIADLEQKFQSQQIHNSVTREAFTNAGINFDRLAEIASQKQS